MMKREDSKEVDDGTNHRSRRRSSGRSSRRSSAVSSDRGDPSSHLKSMQEKARRRAEHAMQAYRGALGELREDMQVSPFASWTLEQLQEFLADHNFEIRGSSMLNRSSFVTILENMFKDTEPPEPPQMLTEEFKRQREKAALMLQEAWFVKKSTEWTTKAMKELDPAPDGFIRDNPLHSPTGVMNAAVRGRISEDTPWQPPSVEVARRFEDELHLRHPGGGKFAVRGVNMGRYCFLGGCGAQLDLWDEGKTSEFAPFGAGVTSYFKLLKYLSWSFLVVSLVVLPHLFVNTSGDGITMVTSNTNKLSWTTVGNLGGGRGNLSSEAVLPFCDVEQYSTCLIDIDTLGLYYGLMDTFIVMFFLAGYMWVNSFIRDEFETIKKTTVTAGDFTVKVNGVPPDITEDEVSGHFSSLLNRKVLEVSIARDNRKGIELYSKSGKLYHERAEMRDLLRYIKTKAISREERIERMDQSRIGEGGRRVAGTAPHAKREGYIERFFRKRKIRQLQEKRSKASRQIIHLAAEAKLAVKMTNKAVAAYVTFDDEMAAIEARVLYSGSWIGRLCENHKMRLRGKRISVEQAPEPSTILWENYGYQRCELFTRRTTTLLIGMSFLTLSIGMSIYALYQSQQAESEGGTAECPADWDSLSGPQQEDRATGDGTILHCLCDDQADSVWALGSDDVCFDYAWAKVQAAWLVLGTSLMVAFTNAVINKVTKMMGVFERHLSVDQQEVAIFRRLVLLKFVNIGLTVLVTNSRRVIDLLRVNIDYEDDFTSDWYRTLGSSLVLNILLNVVTPHIYWLVMWGVKIWKWKHKRAKAISQKDLNNLTKGLRWEASVRYAEITVIFAVCLAYSAGIPILLPIGAFSFVLFYWIEKALFVNFYLTPPQYSGKLTNEVISLIPYTLWVHVAFAFYMYGNGSIFPTPKDTTGTVDITDIADMLKVKAVQPLLIPFFFLSALILERWLGETVLFQFGRMAAVLICKGKIATKKLESLCNTVSVTYSRAVVRGIMRGLPSYNILLNPKYKESFGLSDSFACQHKRVGSVFMMVKEHPSILVIRKAMHEEHTNKRTMKRHHGSPKEKDQSLADTRKKISGYFPPDSDVDSGIVGDGTRTPSGTGATEQTPSFVLQQPTTSISSNSSNNNNNNNKTSSPATQSSTFSSLASRAGAQTPSKAGYGTAVSVNGDVESPATALVPPGHQRMFFSGPAADDLSPRPPPTHPHT